MAGKDAVAVIQALQIMRLVASLDVVACSFFLWDYIITLRLEMAHIWKSEWNTIKVLYLLQRYMPFLDTLFLVLYHQFGENLSTTTCAKVYNVTAILMVLGVALGEVILSLRTWAVWNCDTRISIILSILFLMCWAPISTFVVLFLRSLKFGSHPYPGFKGCFVIEANQALMISWALLMTWNTVILILMLIPGLRAYSSGGNSALMKVVYRDGVVYYLYLFVLSSINIVVVKALPPQYVHLLTSVERCFHSVITSRVLLDIRETSEIRPSDSIWVAGLLTDNGTYQTNQINNIEV